VHEFLGVPFAAAPTGPLRFKSPQKPTSWGPEVKEARERGFFCPQHPVSYVTKQMQSEDCLTLSIEIEKAIKMKTRLPVLVWIHGGSFHADWPDPSLYDGTRLAAIGEVIVVTMNYRLGAAGALSLSEFHTKTSTISVSKLVPGNQAMLDQQAAIEFIRDNADALGADVGRISVFGQSSGGVHAAFHLVS
ncbi:unnamed protein product, partial [Amoebophrya sp. A25]